MDEMEFILEHIQIYLPLTLNIDMDCIEFTIQMNNSIFTIKHKDTLLCSGNFKLDAILNFNDNYLLVKKKFNFDENSLFLNKTEFYKEIRIKGYDYGKQFQNVEKINSTGTISMTKFDGNWVTFLDSILQIYIQSKRDSKLHLPKGFEFFKFSASVIRKKYLSSYS